MTRIDKAYGCLLGGLIGDAMGTPTEGMSPEAIEEKFGWVADFEGDGTDDSLLKYLLCDALVATGGYATSDDWAQAWLDNPGAFSGPKRSKFFVSVQQTFRKLRSGYAPRMASVGNLPSSSSAMSISPVGIVNAGHPRAASAQAQEIGTLIHTGDVSFCQDGAGAIAAAVAEAFKPDATVDSILAAGTAYLKPASGEEMRELIEESIGLAESEGEYKAYRAAYHGVFRQAVGCDSRETVPAVFGVLLLSKCDPKEAAIFGANFGRDTDTIATMAAAIAGAYRGVGALPDEWVKKAEMNSDRDQKELAEELVAVADGKADAESRSWQRIER